MLFSPFHSNISFLAYGINLCHASTLFACCYYFKPCICFALFTIRLLECYINCYSTNSLFISHKVNVKSSPRFTDGQAGSSKHSTESECSVGNIWNFSNCIHHLSRFRNTPKNMIMWQTCPHLDLRLPHNPLPIPPRSPPPWVAFQILTTHFRARPQSPPLCWWLSRSGSCPNPSKPHTRPPGTAPVSQSPQTVFQLVSPKPACPSSPVPSWRNHSEDCQPELPPLSLVTGPSASSWTPSWHGGTPFSWELSF